MNEWSANAVEIAATTVHPKDRAFRPVAFWDAPSRPSSRQQHHRWFVVLCIGLDAYLIWYAIIIEYVIIPQSQTRMVFPSRARFSPGR